MVKFNTLLKTQTENPRKKTSRSSSGWQFMREVVTKMCGNVLSSEEQGASSIFLWDTSRS